MKHVVLRGKGGSGGPSGDEIGFSDYLQVTLPFKDKGVIVTHKFLVGWYVCQLRSAADAVQKPEDQKRETFRSELHRTPIRLALATW